MGMTHDELLAEINLASRGEYANLAVALIAVVELHKPKAHLSTDDLWCQGCYPTMATYPCSTVQAIERELE